MITDKKKLPTIHIYDCGGDLTKRWFVYWYEDGKRIKKYKGINHGTTKEERRAIARRLIKEIQEILIKKIDGFKGTDYAKQYQKIQRFLQQHKHNWRKKTLQTHESRLRMFFHWNQRRVITQERIKDFFAAQGALGKKQNTLSGYYRTFRNIFCPALGDDLLDGFQVKKVPGTPARYYSEAQIRFLSENMQKEEPELWVAVQLLYYCYIRPAEIRQLKMGDVILEDKKICIPAEVSKNKKTQYVVIPEAFYPKLYKVIAGRNPTHYIISDSHQPVGMNWLKIRHQKFLKKHHFDTDKYKLYSWKHTGAVMAVKNGVHIKQLQLQLRHHSLDQVNSYLRQMGVFDMGDFSSKMPEI